MDRWQTHPIAFNGGLVTNMSQLEQGMQAPGSARILVNFEPSIDGGYKRIRGYRKYDQNPVPGTGLIRGVFFANDTVFAVRNDNVYTSGGAGWTRITNNITYSSGLLGITAGTGLVRFESLNFDGNNEVLVADQDDKPFRFKNGVFDQITNAPADAIGTSHIRAFKNHVFLASGNNLIFSAPFTTDDFTPASGGGSINVSSTITGLISFRELLIIFTENSILSLKGSTVSDFSIDPITNDLGCIQPDTIQEIGGDVMFLGPDGLRLLSATERNNDFGLAVVSKRIQKKMNEFTQENQSFCSVTLPTKSQYRLFGYNPSYNNQLGRGILGVQTATQGGENMMWAETVGISARVAHSRFDALQEVAIFANETDYVYRMESANDFDGEDISATFATPYFPITDPSTRKTLYKVDVFTDPQGAFEADINVGLDYDQKGIIQPRVKGIENKSGSDLYFYDQAIYGVATYSSDDVRNFFTLNLEGSAKVFSFRFTSESLAAPFSVDAISIQYAQHGRR